MRQIYIAEPDVIDESLVRKTLAGSSYVPVLGDTQFSGGPHLDCGALLIRSVATVRSDIEKFFPNLRAVIRAGTGLDNVDVEFCKAHNIAVYNAPGANADAVAEYVVAMILSVRRRIYQLTTADIEQWNRFKFVGEGISSQVVGIVGYGNIGKLLVKKLAGLGCSQFLLYDPYLPPDIDLPVGSRLVELEELLRKSNIISLHMPLTDETRHMVDTERLTSMLSGTLLINAARGGIVNEQSLLDIIDEKQLVYVADTVEGEPQANQELVNHPRAVITPHIASLTKQSEERMITLALERFLDATSTPSSRNAVV